MISNKRLLDIAEKGLLITLAICHCSMRNPLLVTDECTKRHVPQSGCGEQQIVALAKAGVSLYKCCKIQGKSPMLPQPIKEWAESFPQAIAP